MSGLKFDDFAPKVISSKTHSIIDYIHARSNLRSAGDVVNGHLLVLARAL